MWFSCFFSVFWLLAIIFWYCKGSTLIKNNYETNKELWGYGDRVEEVIKKVNLELECYFWISFVASTLMSVIGVYFEKNLDFLTMILFIILTVSIFGIYGNTEPAFLGYKGEPIDKNITVKIWNYLALKDKEINKFDLFFRRMTGVTIDELNNVKTTLNSLSEEDLLDIKEAIELSEIGTISEFAFNSVKKYLLALFTTVFGITSLTKIFENYFGDNNESVDTIIQFFASNALLSIFIVLSIFLISLIVLWWLNNLTSVNRRRHCNELLMKYVEEARKKTPIRIE